MAIVRTPKKMANSEKSSRSSAAPAASRSSDGAGDLGRQLALLAAQAGIDKKALGIEIIDVTGRVDYADFLVLMTGTSDRHTASIARGVEEDLGKAGHKALSVEGLPEANWVLLDFFDIVVHVFSEDARGLYDLSGLWIDASRIPIPARTGAASPKFTPEA